MREASKPTNKPLLRSRVVEITGEYWDSRNSLTERVAVAQLILALARTERELGEVHGLLKDCTRRFSDLRTELNTLKRERRKSRMYEPVVEETGKPIEETGSFNAT